MKVILLIVIISSHDGQAPNVQQIPQPDMISCQTQAKSVMEQMRFKGCDGKENCGPPYIVRTSCVTGTG